MTTSTTHNVSIKVDDDTYINGFFTSGDCDKETLLIGLHGFAASGNNHLNRSLAITLAGSHADVFRYTAYSSEDRSTSYSSEKDRRLFTDLTVAQQARDLEAIVTHFSSYSKIIIFANSHGALAALTMDHSSVQSMILVEPALVLDSFWSHKSLINAVDENGREFLVNNGMPGLGLPFCVSFKQRDEGLTFTRKKALELLSNLNIPALIVTADQSIHGKITSELLQEVRQDIPPRILHETLLNCDHGINDEENLANLMDLCSEFIISQ